MSLLSDIGTAIKNKLGGTSVDNTIPRYDGTTCKLQSSSAVIDDLGNLNITGDFMKNGVIFSGGAKGGGTDKVFYENGQTITTDYTIPTGQNAMSAGDITIATGVTVTVPTGSKWVIV